MSNFFDKFYLGSFIKVFIIICWIGKRCCKNLLVFFLICVVNNFIVSNILNFNFWLLFEVNSFICVIGLIGYCKVYNFFFDFEWLRCSVKMGC